MSIRVKCILVNEDNKTLGAVFESTTDGRTRSMLTSDILSIKDSCKLDNAIIDSNGFVRAKSGNLPKILVNSRPKAPQQRDIMEASKLLKQSEITLYHGTKDRSMKPKFGFDNPNNDYGSGFYTTPDSNLGREWAYCQYTSGNKGYLFTYKLDLTGLNVLDLTKVDSLHWIAELAYNRKINTIRKEVLAENIKEFIRKYKIDTSGYDVIIGYRADDSYFTYASDFLSGAIYKDTVDKALRYGDLGIQVFIKSKKAFDHLKQVGTAEAVDESYKEKYIKREKAAKDKYKQDKLFEAASRDKRTINDFLGGHHG